MSSLKMLVLLFCMATIAAAQKSTPADTHYNAVVVEMPFAETGTLAERFAKNFENYLSVLADIPVNADIVVFPEATLNNVDVPTLVPNAEETLITPCTDDAAANVYHSFLVRLSCEAKRLATYLVINLTEKERCSASAFDARPCATNGWNIYNTNVVFDRNGTVISRYRKFHLYGELKNTTLLPEFGVFDTDFGVRFGHFICFDILFYAPAEEMVHKHGITDFIYPTMWFSQLPFLTGVQFQAAWSYGNDVNLLAAGSSSPLSGTTGTGIYNGRNGSLAAFMSQNVPIQAVFMGMVPKKQFLHKSRTKRSIDVAPAKAVPRLDQSSIYLKRDYLDYYESIVVDFSKGSSLNHTMCFNNTDFCCRFEIDWISYASLPSNTKYYTYRLGIFEGWRNVNAFELNKLRNCAVFTCINDDIKDCGKIFPANVSDSIAPQISFKRVLITGLYPTSTEYLLMPNTLKDDLLPLKVKDFEWTEMPVSTENGTRTNVTLLLKQRTDNLMTFAIYGNYYNGTDLRNTAALTTVSVMLVIGTILCMLTV